MKPLRIGTRGSKLALWQAEYVRARLKQELGIESELVVIQTTGDQFSGASIPDAGGKGIFIKEIEDAILDGRVDFAVHSMKDVPTDFCDGCRISIVFEREDPRDCLISHNGETLARLRRSARIGTSSVRRASQLRSFRADLEVVALRGNVDTRLRKLDAGEYDAIVLAKAGIERLGLSSRVAETLSPEVMLPAPGQGALGIEFFEAGRDLYTSFLDRFDHRPTVLAVLCERALQDELQGGCTVPLGAWARVENGAMKLEACVLSPDGTESLRRAAATNCQTSAQAQALGRGLARELLDAGADRLLRLTGRSAGGG
ncbi:MAG TPA: hydroxymethylbilane synthase [Candidatus Acidoferrales bacterium]|nr:hydroxymethylbilane synthase [Candidatus Acidoferrales bacterium]